MSILLLLIPLSLLLVAIAVWAFLWAVDHGQFEDLDRAATSILFDDDDDEVGSEEKLVNSDEEPDEEPEEEPEERAS